MSATRRSFIGSLPALAVAPVIGGASASGGTTAHGSSELELNLARVVATTSQSASLADRNRLEFMQKAHAHLVQSLKRFAKTTEASALGYDLKTAVFVLKHYAQLIRDNHIPDRESALARFLEAVEAAEDREAA